MAVPLIQIEAAYRRHTINQFPQSMGTIYVEAQDWKQPASGGLKKVWPCRDSFRKQRLMQISP
jgi:hypothetical protein